MSARSASTSAKSPRVADEVLVEVGQDLLAQLAQLDREMGHLAGELGLRVVVGEGDVEFGRAADLEPDEIGLEARDEPLLAEDQRHPLGRPALERLAVARPDERDDRVVAVLGAAALDRGERRVLVAQLLEDLADLGVVDDVDLGPEVEVLVVAELDLRADLDGRLEDERHPLLGLDDVDVGVRERDDVLGDERVAVRVLDEVVDGVVEDRARTEVSLQDGAGRLARTEAGDAGALGEVPDGLVHGAADALRWDLDLEEDGGLGAWGLGDLHRPGSIRATPDRGRMSGSPGPTRDGAGSSQG